MKFDDLVSSLLGESDLHPGHDPQAMRDANRPAYRPSAGDETSVVRGKTSRVTDIFNPKVNKPAPDFSYNVKIVNAKTGKFIRMATAGKDKPWPWKSDSKLEALAKVEKLNKIFADKGYHSWKAEIVSPYA